MSPGDIGLMARLIWNLLTDETEVYQGVPEHALRTSRPCGTIPLLEEFTRAKPEDNKVASLEAKGNSSTKER
jgi:hypothetical protein